jgi:hypothetical protein
VERLIRAVAGSNSGARLQPYGRDDIVKISSALIRSDPLGDGMYWNTARLRALSNRAAAAVSRLWCRSGLRHMATGSGRTRKQWRSRGPGSVSRYGGALDEAVHDGRQDRDE